MKYHYVVLTIFSQMGILLFPFTALKLRHRETKQLACVTQLGFDPVFSLTPCSCSSTLNCVATMTFSQKVFMDVSFLFWPS